MCVIFQFFKLHFFLLNSGRYNFYYFSIYYIAIIMIILLLIVSDCIYLVFKLCLKRHTTIHLSGECLLVGCSDKLSHKMFVSCCCRIHGSVWKIARIEQRSSCFPKGKTTTNKYINENVLLQLCINLFDLLYWLDLL